MTNIELFKVSTRAAEFKGHKNVCLHWFVYRRNKPLDLPYASLIADYDAVPDDLSDFRIYVETAVDELFTDTEAQALFTYLKRRHGATADDTKIEKVRLPMPNNVMGYQCVPVGGPQDFYMLWRKDGYSLPFKAEAYYDLRFSEYMPTTTKSVANTEDENTILTRMQR